VLVRDNYLLSAGYGGSVVGQPHCAEVGCDIDPKTSGCIRTVHAESNAILCAAKHGVSTANSTLYCTLSPCAACFKLLINAGVKRIVYVEQYRIPPDRDLAIACGVELVHFASPGLISIPEAELQQLLAERKRLYEQIAELQKNNTDLVLRLRQCARGE
jgi:deoxycytidylate deaminase